MPVQTVTIRGRYLDGRPYEISKPVYWCACGAPGHFGMTVQKGGRRVREWFCGWRNGEPVCEGKGKNGTGQH